MDQRYIFAALAGVLCLVVVLATITTIRHVGKKPDPVGTNTHKAPAIKKQDRTNTIAVRPA